MALVLGATLVAGPTSSASAAEVWVGDFETGDLSQWNFVLNGEVDGMTYAFAQTELLSEGMFGGRLELHNEAVWPNGLKRVELQHSPSDERTAEGATTFFAWSFYLPEALPSDPSQQIAYWESNNTYQQMMAFSVEGENIAFHTRQPMNVQQWQADGAVTPGQWHRIAMGVTWSTDPGQGTVDVWFDGMQVVDQGPARTLADNNPHFVQVGLLRGQIEFEDVPVIIIDDAVEGDTLEDVRPDDLPTEGGDDSGSDDGMGETSGGMGGDTDGGTHGDGMDDGIDPDPPPPQTSGAMDGSGSGSGADDAGGSDDDAGGCGCRTSDRGGLGGVATGLLLLMFGRRRRGRWSSAC